MAGQAKQTKQAKSLTEMFQGGVLANIAAKAEAIHSLNDQFSSQFRVSPVNVFSHDNSVTIEVRNGTFRTQLLFQESAIKQWIAQTMGDTVSVQIKVNPRLSYHS